MAKINQYPAKTVPSNNDEFVLHDPASGSTKKMTRGDLIGGAPLPANSVNGQAIADGSVTSSKLSISKNVDANGWTVYNYGTFKKYAKNYQINTSTTVQAGDVNTVPSPGKTPYGQAMGAGDVYVTSGVRVPHTASSRAAALQAQPRWDATLVGGDITIILANPTNTNLNAQYYWVSIEITTL